jgi:rhodanese-related sulfurtransferase
VPRDRRVVIYCACPDEVSAAWLAGQLRRRGYLDAVPLRGGIDAWRAAGLPVAPIGGEGTFGIGDSRLGMTG